MFLAGAFIAVGSLYAQSSDAEWQAGVAKLKETIQTNPAQAAEEAEHPGPQRAHGPLLLGQ